MKFNSGLYMTLGAVMLGLSAALLDIKYRKIPNWLTFPAMLTGVVINLLLDFDSWRLSLLGLLVGFLILLIPFLLGGIGAGDVKLLMALGAFLGAKKVISVGLCSGIAGGVMALLALALKDGLFNVRQRVALLVASIWDKDIRRIIFRPNQRSRLVIPFGPAILVGLLVGLILGPFWE